MSVSDAFNDDTILQLQKFTREAWGNSSLMLLTHPHLNVKYLNLDEYLPAFEKLFPTAVCLYDKILVRQEYCDALQALKEGTMYKRGACITGQSGIGKTMFLVYILVMSLGEKRKVALQFPDGRPFYALFQEAGFSIHDLNNGRLPHNDLAPSEFMWALSDSNYATKGPSLFFFSEPCKIRVIQTISLGKEESEVWRNGAHYVMDLWTREEIETLANLLNLNVDRMTSLGEKWGNNPRNLLRFIEHCYTDLQIEEIYRDEAPVAVTRSKDIISSITENALIDNAPMNFYFCRPMFSKSRVNRTRACAFVPTNTICRILGEHLQYRCNNVKLTFFQTLSQYDETHSSARYIYGHLFHNFFSAGNPIQCQWVWPDDSVIKLKGVPDVAPSKWSGLTRNAPFFWVAPKNTPGIESVLVLEDAIYVFQVTLTISSTHVSPIDGMKKVRKYLRPRLRDIAWKVIFIGQANSVIVSVANGWANKLFFPTRSTSIPIAWAEVDPAVQGVQYKDFHGEEVELAAQGSSSKGKKRSIGEVGKPDQAPDDRTRSRRTRKKT